MRLIAIHKALHRSGPACFCKEGRAAVKDSKIWLGTLSCQDSVSLGDAVHKSRENLLCLTGVLLHLDGDFRGICVALADA